MNLGFGTGTTGTNLFGSTPGTTAAATGLGGFGGFSFGNAQPGSTLTTAAPATGFSLTGALDPSQGQQKAVRFDTGTAATQVSTVAPSAPLTLGGFLATSTAAAPGGGFSFSTPAATTAATSTLSGLLGGNKPTLTLGATTTTAAPTTSGFGFSGAALGGGLGTTTSLGFGAPTLGAGTTTSLGFGATTLGAGPTTSLGFGATTLGAGPTTSLGFGATTLGAGTTSLGLGGGLMSGTATTSSIFGATTGTTVSQGLGGVDLKTASSACGGTGSGSSKTCDGRALKENPVDPIILNSIEEFIKHVKNQKGIRENISRMSSKPLCKVKENMKTLQQQLMLVSNGFQKNSAAIANLKKEATQELKYAEMAHRTKDTPPGLQYENTAPTEYFHRLTEEFETHMMLYRQQIVDTENHLISLNQTAMLTPQELSQLFAKLNDGFIALAAQLQVVHEAVRNQKEQYLEYRKMYHGDAKDIFARRKKVQDSIMKTVPSTIGPTPFSAAAGIGTLAQPTQTTLPQQTTAGTGSSGFGFGATQTGFGQTAQGTGSLFGTTATSGTGMTFGGTAAPATGLFGSTGTSAFGSTGLTGAPTLNFSPATTTAQAQKPFGSKRGKNA